MVWMAEVNGLIMDLRHAPRQLQAAAYAKGIIPYIPADQAPSTSKPSTTNPGSADALYTLDVFIVDGPVTEKFVKQNPIISRTIAIKGNQTLADLHRIIFQAFDREEEHMYEFQVGGGGPQGFPTALC